jgi:hypothetical protein
VRFEWIAPAFSPLFVRKYSYLKMGACQSAHDFAVFGEHVVPTMEDLVRRISRLDSLGQ